MSAVGCWQRLRLVACGRGSATWAAQLPSASPVDVQTMYLPESVVRALYTWSKGGVLQHVLL